MREFLLRYSRRAAKTILVGVAFFVLLSLFSSDPSPETESKNRVERTCENDWKRCDSDEELLKNWNYELKPSTK